MSENENKTTETTAPREQKKSELLDSLLKKASEVKATDLHITVGSVPVLRINSELCKVEGYDMIKPPASKEIVEAITDREKFQKLDENGEVDFSFSQAGLGRYRVNIYKQRGTFSLAIRSLPYSIPLFESLGVPLVIKSFTKKTKGLILVVGVSGSGKSTTMASLLNIINAEKHVHIITIEDPIEYIHRHQNSIVNQREIGADTKTFGTALRAALREDPDVIMVGEMRDPETISIALTAAETGHLVFSTLHTLGAAKTIDRIIDGFPPNQQNQIRSQVATVLEGVVSQQLVPRLDGKGVVPACEVMVMTPAIRNLIREGKPYQINSVIQTSSSVGMQSLEINLADLCNKGIISHEEAMLKATDQQLLMQYLNKRW